jgi:hypothetical protein
MIGSTDSNKRERNIQTRRIKNRFHARLSKFCEQRNYPTLFDGLEYLGEFGLDYLEVWGDVPPKDALARTTLHMKEGRR